VFIDAKSRFEGGISCAFMLCRSGVYDLRFLCGIAWFMLACVDCA
jgi:hypothetical protein